ncbi:MAG: sigma-54-dependent Fis family transcriptional regulator [Acidobacteria bacterium]|nr:sigma-54-dependent Fis family transcriptional regulator [Acidobacteriota bacterium]
MTTLGRGRVIVVDDDPSSNLAMKTTLKRDGYDVAAFADGLDAVAFLREHPDVEVVVTDLKMPRISGIEVLRRCREIVSDVEVLVVTGFGDVEHAVEAMKLGAADFLEKPVNAEILRTRTSNLVEKVRLAREVSGLLDVRNLVLRQGSFEGMVGGTPPMIELYRQIQQVAEARSSVLILGESGTGKELVARAIHRRSTRARQTFLPMDCASIPSELLESELFGHERGAFTGAAMRKPGKLELADGGTLFLDEIGEMRADLQAKLLRALETRSFMRVGGTTQVQVDVRVIAATNRDLGRLAEAGEFRQDLYYRLAVVTLRVPALRDRPEDIPAMAQYFLDRFAAENARPLPKLAPETIRSLKAAPWPGNVRELRNVMESLVILHPGESILPSHLPEEVRPLLHSADLSEPREALAGRTMEEIERDAILQSLERTQGNRTQAAEMLGIGLRTLQRKLKQYREDGFPVAEGD